MDEQLREVYYALFIDYAKDVYDFLTKNGLSPEVHHIEFSGIMATEVFVPQSEYDKATDLLKELSAAKSYLHI